MILGVVFQATYPNSLRPKHHHRLHLPKQWQAMPAIATCWGTEAKHKDYKSVFSTLVQHFLQEKNGGSEFSRQLLPRLLNRHCHLLNETPFNSKGFQLLHPFAPCDVERATAMRGCSISAQCRVNMLELREKDLILWNYPVYTAGFINFFIEEDNELFLHLTLCQNMHANAEALLSFRALNKQTVLKWSQMLAPTVPTWWQGDANQLFCLP